MFIKYQVKYKDFVEIAEIKGVTRGDNSMVFTLSAPNNNSSKIVVRDIDVSSYETLLNCLYESGKVNLEHWKENTFEVDNAALLNRAKGETIMKTIVYSYLFNYFGKEKYNGRAVTGAGVDLAVKCYRRDEEVKFDDEEPSVLVSIDGTEQKEYLCSVFDVLFDRKNAFKVVKNPNIDNLFRLSFGYDKIEFKVMGYFLDIVIGPTRDVHPH